MSGRTHGLRVWATNWPRIDSRRILTYILTAVIYQVCTTNKYKQYFSDYTYFDNIKSYVPVDSYEVYCPCMLYIVQCELLNRTVRSTVLGANQRLANAKSSMFFESNPHAACMDEMHRAERNSTVRTTSNIFVGRPDFDFFVRCENTASCIYTRRHAGASQLRLRSCAVALWSRTCFAACCAGWLRCAVLCCACGACGMGVVVDIWWCSATTCSYIFVHRTYNKKSRKNRYILEEGSSSKAEQSMTIIEKRLK